MSWYKFSFKANEATNNILAQTQAEFTSCFYALKAPKQLALFSAWERNRDKLAHFVHTPPTCEPFLEGFLSKYHAATTSRPKDYDDISLLVGYSNSKSLL